MILPVLDLEAALGTVGAASAIGVGAVFLSAGMAKLRSRKVFPGILANYRLLPVGLVNPVAAGLPIVEVAIGASLIAGLSVAVLPAAGLLLVFAGAMAINIRRGRTHIDCGCGRSDLRQPLTWKLVLRNVMLAALLIPSLLPMPRIGSAEWLVALAAGAALYLLTLLVNALAALAQGPLAMERNSR